MSKEIIKCEIYNIFFFKVIFFKFINLFKWKFLKLNKFIVKEVKM